MKHIHYWHIDSSGMGACKCGETKDFNKAYDKAMGYSSNALADSVTLNHIMASKNEYYMQGYTNQKIRDFNFYMGELDEVSDF